MIKAIKIMSLNPLYLLKQKLMQWKCNCLFTGRHNTEIPDIKDNRTEFPLHYLKKGNNAVIKYIDSHDRHQLQKILAMGILPNRYVHVIQTYPVMVIKIDETQLAMDKELAQCIIVSEY